MSVTRRRTASHHETSRALNVTVTLQLAMIASSCACRLLLRALLHASTQNVMMKTNQQVFLQCRFLGAIQITALEGKHGSGRGVARTHVRTTCIYIRMYIAVYNPSAWNGSDCRTHRLSRYCSLDEPAATLRLGAGSEVEPLYAFLIKNGQSRTKCDPQ